MIYTINITVEAIDTAPKKHDSFYLWAQADSLGWQQVSGVLKEDEEAVKKEAWRAFQANTRAEQCSPA